MRVELNGTDVSVWYMDFTHKEIAEASAKTNSIDIPLTDGSTDLTELLSGKVRYKNRQIKIDLEIRAPRHDWPGLISAFQAAYNGKMITVRFSDDTEHFWEGRASVGPLKDKKATAGITVTVDALPFKREMVEKTMDVTVAASETVTVLCREMRGYPLFYVSADMTVSDGVETYSLTAAQQKAYGLEFSKGENELTFEGSGTVEIRWREATL